MEQKIIIPTEEEAKQINISYTNIGDENGLTETDKGVLKHFDEIHLNFRKELIKQMKEKNKVAVVKETGINEKE